MSLLHHYFVIVRTSFADAGLSDKQIWALAETAAFALTSLTPEAKNFWPWDKQGYYTNHNYPEIVELQKKLERPFVERKSFDEYVRAGIEVVINNQF
ncbi:hypothetical protein HQ524_00330 [Candidatus Uhrbacteria bacterium]|nr:hypothetical protein [Candidatus Uhrbacteria bacterium]